MLSRKARDRYSCRGVTWAIFAPFFPRREGLHEGECRITLEAEGELPGAFMRLVMPVPIDFFASASISARSARFLRGETAFRWSRLHSRSFGVPHDEDLVVWRNRDRAGEIACGWKQLQKLQCVDELMRSYTSRRPGRDELVMEPDKEIGRQHSCAPAVGFAPAIPKGDILNCHEVRIVHRRPDPGRGLRSPR